MSGRRFRRLACALPLVLALYGCQLRYQVSLCRAADEQVTIETMIDRPGDARVDRVAIYAGGNDPSAGPRAPDWEAVSPGHVHRPIYRIPFGQPIPGFETRGPPLAFDPARGYRIEVDGEWHGRLIHDPHHGAIGACD